MNLHLGVISTAPPHTHIAPVHDAKLKQYSNVWRQGVGPDKSVTIKQAG